MLKVVMVGLSLHVTLTRKVYLHDQLQLGIALELSQELT